MILSGFSNLFYDSTKLSGQPGCHSLCWELVGDWLCPAKLWLRISISYVSGTETLGRDRQSMVTPPHRLSNPVPFVCTIPHLSSTAAAPASLPQPRKQATFQTHGPYPPRSSWPGMLRAQLRAKHPINSLLSTARPPKPRVPRAQG